MNKKSEKKNNSLKIENGPLKAVFVLTAFLVIGYFTSSYIHRSDVLVPISKPDFFSNIKLEARSVFVFDTTNNKEIYSKNPDEILPLASIAKIMPVITALDILGEDYIVEISYSALMEQNDDGLKEGEKWKLKDLAEFSLITSSNDGIKAIALEAEEKLSGKNNSFIPNFLNEVQKKTYDAGIYTRVINPTGLDLNNGESGGAYSTAKGAVLMLAEGLKKYPEVFYASSQKEALFRSLSGIEHKAVNTDKVIGEVHEIIASKTGLTDLAGGNLVVAIRTNNGDVVLISVLGSSQNGRFEDVKKLSE